LANQEQHEYRPPKEKDTLVHSKITLEKLNAHLQGLGNSFNVWLDNFQTRKQLGVSLNIKREEFEGKFK